MSARIDPFSRPAGGVLAPPQKQVVTKADPHRHFGEFIAVDGGGAHLGHLTLDQVAVAGEEQVAHHERQHGVAEELEPLVRCLFGVLGGIGAVDQGAVQQLSVGEPVTEQRLEWVSPGGRRIGHRAASRVATRPTRSWSVPVRARARALKMAVLRGGAVGNHRDPFEPDEVSAAGGLRVR